MDKFSLTLAALALAVITGCASTSGTLVGTSATTRADLPYQPDAIAGQIWTNDD